MIFLFFFKTKYWCFHPHWSKNSVSPVCGILKFYLEQTGTLFLKVWGLWICGVNSRESQLLVCRWYVLRGENFPKGQSDRVVKLVRKVGPSHSLGSEHGTDSIGKFHPWGLDCSGWPHCEEVFKSIIRKTSFPTLPTPPHPLPPSNQPTNQPTNPPI